MAFDVIPGGLLLERLQAEDIPAPDKPIEEWTQEEEEEYNRYCYENAEPGSIEHGIKSLAPEALEAAITGLESIRAALEAEAAATGFRNEWEHLPDVIYLYSILKQRQQSEAGAI